MFFKISQNSQENTNVGVSLLIKLQAQAFFIKKETVTQLFPCKFCKIFRTPFLHNTSSGCFDSTVFAVFAIVKSTDRNTVTKLIKPNSDYFVKSTVHKLNSDLCFQTYGRFPTPRRQCWLRCLFNLQHCKIC